ncbi:cation diffusion facilitator family transporter [Sporobolomyces koalae]|uniref:cation diffusion facilitator family transporter n=1 Tax=Sporobolomyces koalae TaxID=500713 RepID=UPI0031799486
MSSGGYAEAYDPRRSGRVSLTSLGPQLRNSRDVASLPSDLLFSVLLSKSLLALALHISRDWLLGQGYSAWTLNTVALTVGGACLVVWERSWEPPRGAKRRLSSPSPLYPVLYTFEILFALFAIYRLSVLHFVLLTSFAPLWTRGLPFLARTSSKKAVGSGNALFMTVAMIAGSYAVERTISGAVSRRGYLSLLLHLLLCGQRSEILASQIGDEQVKAKMHANGVLLAGPIALGLNLFYAASASSAAKLAAKEAISAPFQTPESTMSINIPSAALLGLSLVVIDPLLARALLSHFPSARLVGSGWPLTILSTAFVGYVGFGHGVSWGEGAVAIIAWNGISHITATDPRSNSVTVSSGLATGSSSSTQPFLARISNFYRHFRATIKSILASAESRRIYYFLCLNLAFMFVQMAYGIWTNSLGLISDSIHMFFDCLALAMGLFASVMANWPSNDVFTYGYSRVETLSGFANGLFLCLISIFIVFEAIQRLIDPPEMNTGQLLTVSAVGLAVNLVGMVATGHGHHGHSHGGGGGHAGHGHSHAPVRSNSTPFLTNEKEAQNGHSGHSHTPTSSPVKSAHAHTHASPTPSHSHSPSSAHSHSHSHSYENGKSHGHGRDSCDHHPHADAEDDDDDGAEHAAQSGHSHNMKGVFLHVMADTLGSVGVIISTLLINRYGWTGFDPLASIFIAVLIFASVVPLVADSGKLLVLDLGEEKEAEVRKALTAVQRLEGVASFTRPRFWQKDPASVVGSICVQLAPSPGSQFDRTRAPDHFFDAERVTTRVRKALRSHIGGLDDLTIQVEPSGG